MAEKRSSLHQFHPLVRQWFKERFGKPTDIQEKSWPKIAMGEHVLITAPTGSGKTLTAFLWAVDQLITGRYPTGHTSILYISPLKALNNDIQRNLVKPLEELRRIFDRVKEPLPSAPKTGKSNESLTTMSLSCREIQKRQHRRSG